MQKQATEDDGVWKLPDGEAYYNYLLENFTTTKLTASEIHEIGLREVARLHDDIRKLMKQVDFKGDLPQFFEFMRTDPQFYHPDTDAGRAAWLADARGYIVAMRAKLPQLFVTLPQSEVEVRAVEPFREKSAGKAFYQRPSLDGTRPAIFYGNLYQMKEMPKYELEALVYHEAIPGHHMQNAIATEENIPAALPAGRRLLGVFGEGWGLYSERLGKEMGFYDDPWSEFGRLALELHRAVRLVVDTGLHAKRWTRDQTIRYHVENSATSEEAAVRATERYILNPGQATAYMIGMLKIVELRERATAALGPKFDVREFHDLVLRTGGVPLTVLEVRSAAFHRRQARLRDRPCVRSCIRSCTQPPRPGAMWSSTRAAPCRDRRSGARFRSQRPAAPATSGGTPIATSCANRGYHVTWILETHAPCGPPERRALAAGRARRVDRDRRRASATYSGPSATS